MKELKEDNDILREKIQDLEASAVSSTQYYPAYRSLLIFFISVSYENFQSSRVQVMIFFILLN